MQAARRLYRPVDAVMLRATPTVPERCPPWPVTDEVGALCGWLRSAWSSPSLARAVAVASPALAGQIEAVCVGRRPRAADTRRMAIALARYLTRSSSRATPFGLFAGVTAARIGPAPVVRWGGDHTVLVRPDAAWLADVVGRLEAALWPQLPIVASDVVAIRGDELVVAWQPAARTRLVTAARKVTMKATAPVRTVLEIAASALPAAVLVDKLAAAYPDAAGEAVRALIAELIGHGALITSLRPASIHIDPLGHLLDQLTRVDTTGLPEAAELVAACRTAHADLRAASGSLWTAEAGRRAAAARLGMVCAAPPMLMVDLRMDCEVTLPEAVIKQAAVAADVLARLTPLPSGDLALRAYHRRFCDRYGVRALVAVTDLIDPTTGLGLPDGYLGARPAAARPVSDRDLRLLALAQQAALDGAEEVVLDDEDVAELAGLTDPPRIWPHAELQVEVRAESIEALGAGRFQLAVVGTGRSGVALSGRFLTADAAGEQRLPASVQGAVPAQLSFPARTCHAQNVGRAPRLVPALISAAEYQYGPGHIPLSDLAITADHQRLYAISLSQRRVVEPVLSTALALHTMPPVVRLLAEIGRSWAAHLSPFGWGEPARALPWLPRLCCGRIILTPARWRVPASELRCSADQWPTVLDQVRARRGLPSSVGVGAGDTQLRLCLDDPLGQALLRAQVENCPDPAFVLTEAPDPGQDGWIGRRHEITVPLVTTTPPAAAPTVLTAPGPLSLLSPAHAQFPGDGPLLSAYLYAHPDVHEQILVTHVPRLLASWDGAPPRWWFIPYLGDGPHLRLRLHTDLHPDAATRLGVWAAQLREAGLLGDMALTTYRPETVRYGTGPALAAAEDLFAADSACALAQLTAARAVPDLAAAALTAASLMALVCALAGDRATAVRWWLDLPRSTVEARIRDRGLQRRAVAFADELVDADTTELPELPGVAAAWSARRAATTAYTTALAVRPGPVTSSSVVMSLLHLHCVRAHGIDPAQERECLRLARGIALAWAARAEPEGRP